MELFRSATDVNAVQGGVEILDEKEKVSVEERISSRYMTKYEKARVLGTRALQIR